MPSSPAPARFNRHPMLLLGLYFAIGIAIVSSVGFPITLAVVFFGAVALGSLAYRSYIHVLVPLCFVPLGIVCYQIEINSIDPDRIRQIYSDGRIQSGEPVEIDGVIDSQPEMAFDGEFVNLSVERIRYQSSEIHASGNVRLFSADAALNLRYGDRIRVMCRLLREEQYRNPGVRSRIATLDEQGIDATAVIKSPLLVEKLGTERVFIPFKWLHEWRQRLINAFRDNLSPPTAGVMIASLLGDKHFLDRQTADAFRDGGTFHVLVISGLHITFIGGLTFWVVSLFTRREMWRCLLPAAFLWAYTIAVGAEVPVVRASLMFSILLLGRLINRSGSLLNALGTCGLVLLVWRPSDLFSASFQLTFVSVAAIVACAFPLVEKLRVIGNWHPTAVTPLPPNVSPPLRRFCEMLYWNETAWRIEKSRQVWSANLFKTPYLERVVRPTLQSITAYLFEGLLVSFIVQLWMLPLLVIYFHRISPASLILNLWVGVFLAFESFAAVFAVVIGAFSHWLSTPLIAMSEFFNGSMMWLPSLLSRTSAAGFRLPVYSGAMRAVYVVYALSIVFAAARLFQWDIYALAKRQRSYMTPAIVVLTAVVIIFHPLSAPRADGKLTVDFLDVGQGDSALVTFPTGQTLLIDGGGQLNISGDGEFAFEPDRMRIGEAVVSEFLWEKGYSQIDYVLATHADADHMEGLIDVVRNFDVRTLLIGDTRESPILDELLAVASAKKVPLRIVDRGDALIIAKSRVDFLNPAEDSSASDNDKSVVTHITYGSRSFLMTGDIERPAEMELPCNELRSDVIKVPHHGSRTSSSEAFVENVRPEIAIISVGLRSRFGHPHREVVERWITSGATVMTTGENGTITISTDGLSLDVKTFVQ